MRTYDPRDWYWIVGGGKTEVYASARRAYVPIADAAYQAFRAAGGAPSRIASEDELRAVLAEWGLRFKDDRPVVPLATILRRLAPAELAVIRQAFAADDDVFRLALVGAGQGDVKTGSAEMETIKAKLKAAAPQIFTDARVDALLAAED